ncbi:NUDIX domain-containing protein [Streptomyces sp. NRRL F-5135]|uniref:nucleotide triphosphate diphosphatase NUDT15 n=1 Tax=Streptomyces sp. NRRL F-5135 TaxID=1463858 RepID=UPI00068F543C
MIGVGVIVRDGAGRVLLGLHRGGTWELPGGALEPGESVAAAAVRELREETGLRAHEHDVTVFAMLLDTAVGAPREDRPDKGGDTHWTDGTDAGLARVTMAAVVTVYDGAVLAAEPELIRHWRWTRADELPSPLFTPSAQVLAAWRPELDIEHGPVHRLDVLDRTAPGTGPGFGPATGLGPPVQGFRATPA